MVQTGALDAKKTSGFWPSLQRVLRLAGFPRYCEHEDEFRDLSGALRLVSLGKRVSLAFQNIPPTEIEKLIIYALIRQPGANAIALSIACGWKLPIWQIHFGLMCQKRIDWLLPPELRDEVDAQFIHGILLDYSPTDGSFRMKAEVEEIFQNMDLGQPLKTKTAGILFH